MKKISVKFSNDEAVHKMKLILVKNSDNIVQNVHEKFYKSLICRIVKFGNNLSSKNSLIGQPLLLGKCLHFSE